MTCGECSSSAKQYYGQSLKNSKYTYCSLRTCGTYKYNGCKLPGWTKVNKNSQPKWCPLNQFEEKQE